MDDTPRNAGLVVLAVVAVTGLTLLFLELARPSGALVEYLFPRL